MDRALWMTVIKSTRSLRGVPPRTRRPDYDDRLVLRLYLWSVLHDRPLCWACRRTSYGRLFRPRRLPSISQFCRRVAEKRFLKLLHLVHGRLTQVGVACSLWFFDGKALPVGPHSADPDANSGYGAGRVGRGYRLHALATDDGRIREFRVTAYAKLRSGCLAADGPRHPTQGRGAGGRSLRQPVPLSRGSAARIASADSTPRTLPKPLASAWHGTRQA